MKYYSQYGQDYFLDKYVFHGKREGFFIEIGADDGITHSNSYFFEKYRDWNGICIEPRETAFRLLEHNRRSKLENCCVSGIDGIVDFVEASGYSDQLSGIKSNYTQSHYDRLLQSSKENRNTIKTLKLPSKKLQTIFNTYKVSEIDFISVDTEGSELEILKTIDFSQIVINAILVENNYHTPDIAQYLSEFGYVLYHTFRVDQLFLLDSNKDPMRRYISKLRLQLSKVVYPLSIVNDESINEEDFSDQNKLMNKANQHQPTIFDVGANVGQTTKKYRRLFPDCTIHAFEPFPEAIEKYQSLFGTTSTIKINQLALSDKIGTANFYLNKCHYTNSLIPTISKKERNYHDNDDQLENFGEIEVKTITLDDYCRQNKVKHINILKIDTQGSELMVLKGAVQSLEKGLIDIIYCEVEFFPIYEKQPLYDDIKNFLSTYGYSLYSLYNLSRVSDGRLISADVIFISPTIKNALT